MDEEKKEIINGIEASKYYFIFGQDSILNKWISKMLRLRIKESFKIESDDKIMIDLNNDFSTSNIVKYINWIQNLIRGNRKVNFIALDIEDNKERSKNLIVDIKEENNSFILDYIDVFVKENLVS